MYDVRRHPVHQPQEITRRWLHAACGRNLQGVKTL